MKLLWASAIVFALAVALYVVMVKLSERYAVAQATAAKEEAW